MAIMPTSSTSDRRLLLLALTALIGWSSTASARKPRKNKTPVVVETAPAPAPAPKPVSPSIPLWPSALPLLSGPVPEGLANQTAQACAACHFESHGSWLESAHAVGWRSEAFQQAVEVAATPLCEACHLPLASQSPDLVDFDQGDPNKPVTSPNPMFDAAMRLEGVTCAACHVRDGKIVGPRPPEELTAPHPMTWSKDLTASEGCASCHQLQWDGATTPFYDTFGEWRRSPQAAAGIGCQDCHGGSGAGQQAPFDHRTPAGQDRAVSVLFDLPSLTVVRGADTPVPLHLTLQNTGAGHAYPTGSPFKGVQVRVQLVGPEDRKKKAPWVETALTHDLKRTLTDGPPWDVTADTRIPAGGAVELEAELSIPYNAPEGDWFLVVELLETVQGEVADRVPRVTRRLPLRVE